MSSPEQEPLVTLVSTMARLRSECAWKSAQTHRSLSRYLLEEAHETLEAIDSGDAEHLREELGDLLLQVYFHAAIAAEAGQFDIDDVARDLQAKLVRRNPHVFGEEVAGTAAEVNERWQAIKAEEKRRSAVTEGLAPTLPALLYADKVLDRLHRAGDDRAVATGPTTSAETVGEELLAVVARARAADVDPEQALRDVVARQLGRGES